MSSTDPSFSIACELGELLVTNLELKNLQDELHQVKQDILEKNNLLKEILALRKCCLSRLDQLKTFG